LHYMLKYFPSLCIQTLFSYVLASLNTHGHTEFDLGATTTQLPKTKQSFVFVHSPRKRTAARTETRVNVLS
jgi:hypothetical protein